MNKQLEEAIKRCNQLIKVEHANWIGISNQSAIETVLKELERLQEENRKMKTEIAEHVYWESTPLNEIIKRYIPKDKIREKIIIDKNKSNNSTNDILKTIYKARIELEQDLLEGK